MREDGMQDIFYSLPEVWDLCLEKMYNQPAYVAGLMKLMESEGIIKSSKILDTGCGSNFPALYLVKEGYDVVYVGMSREMIRQIVLNAAEHGTGIEAHHAQWSNLGTQFGPIFDFVYCGGNSLIYAASWEQNWIVPLRSKEEIAKAIKNFYQVLKPGGVLYVDITSKDEVPYEKSIGILKTKHGPAELLWRIEHDIKNQIRTWIITLNFTELGQKKVYPSYSYFLKHDELKNLFQEAGFKKVDEYVPVVGEDNYDVFLCRKE